MRVKEEWGLYISLTGAVFLTALFAYYLAYKEITEITKKEKFFNYNFFCIITTILYFSLSIHFNSIFLSFITTIYCYILLGFKNQCFGLGYIFESKYEEIFESRLNKIGITSFVLMAFYVILRTLNLFGAILDIYKCPIQLFGALTYFVCLLIFAFQYEKTFDEKLTYSVKQIIFIGSLPYALFFGYIINLPSLTNTGYIFAVLYIMEKIIELIYSKKDSISLLIFIISLFLWIYSLYLYRHPEMIVSIFIGS